MEEESPVGNTVYYIMGGLCFLTYFLDGPPILYLIYLTIPFIVKKLF